MTKIIWKKDHVISVNLGGNHYVPLQMWHSPWLIGFNVFTENDYWGGVDLNKVEVWFCKAFAGRINKLGARKITDEIKILKNFIFDKRQIETDYNPDGKFPERAVKIIRYDPFLSTKDFIKSINESDKVLVSSLETSHLETNETLIERLIFSFREGRNVSPIRGLVCKGLFDSELDDCQDECIAWQYFKDN